MELKVSIKKQENTWRADSNSSELELTLTGYPTRKECMVALIDHLKKNTSFDGVLLQWSRQKMFPSKDYPLNTFVLFGDKSRSITTMHWADGKKIERFRNKDLDGSTAYLVDVLDNEALCIVALLP